MAANTSGRTPPQNIEAEQAYLGSLLINPKNIEANLGEEESAALSAEDFYHSAHSKIYRAILSLRARSAPVDLITLCDELQAKSQLEAVGGTSYVSSLTSIVPTSTNSGYYANIVKEHSLRRNILQLAAEIGDEAYNESHEINSIIDGVEGKIFDIANKLFKGSYRHVNKIIPRVLKQIEHRKNNPETLSGVPSGFSELDSLTDGFQNSEFVVIGARPSIGKTAFALSIIRNICVRDKIPAGFFSLEMAEEQLMQRIISMETHIPADYLRKGKLNKTAMISLVHLMPPIYDAPLWICDTANMRLLDLKAQCRRMKSQHDVRIIFIDYLSIITSENETKDRHLQVAEFSRNLKSLARELEIPIVALSQLSRDTENKVPHLASIRESGAIEQDADLVLFLHRDRQEDNRVEHVDTQLLLAKNRNGPTGILQISFLPKFAEFKQSADIDPHPPKQALE